ncbi:hypothetical protein GCM10023188_30530 [Pontibacter saemangeumensis]|uniref:Uncharacterized protein n=1 Tax=Pontibacter saemangeumensis TaxID=1084525 RepID=A0ABP8LX84_9BACT
MEELAKLSAALKNSSSLLLKQRRNSLECQFVEKGLVRQVLPVRCEVLAAALWQASVLGILEGFEFRAFKNSFESFSIRVKARMLYRELSATLPLASEAQHILKAA